MGFLFLLFIIFGGISEFQNFIHPSAAQKYITGKFCALELPFGSLRGNIEFGRDGQRYCSFLGIRYAKPPARFEEAEEVDDVVGFRDATKPGAICAQVDPKKQLVGSEDCLFLNVYFPIDGQCQNRKLEGRSRLHPVIFHIHGGGFEHGSSTDYDPKYLMSECTVFVSLNYRMGAFGFLSTADEVIPGNLGVKDIILGLKWVQKNIVDFGGDPNSVTAIGHSAGSTLVNHMVLSAAAKGLFHRVMAFSCSALSRAVLQKACTKTARTLAGRLNCTRRDVSSNAKEELTSSDIRHCLLRANMKDILKNQIIKKWASYPVATYGPTVESLLAPHPVHTINPLYKKLTGDFNRVPILMGFTENEGGFMNALPTLMNPEATSEMNTKWNKVAPMSLYYDENWIPQSMKDYFSSEIRRFFFGNKNVSMDTFQNLVDLESDRIFVQGIFDSVELYSRFTKVYPYVFSFKGNQSYLDLYGYPHKIATHGDDIPLLFKTDLFPEITEKDPQIEFSKKYIKLLVSFAETGIPSATWPKENIIKPYKNDLINPYNWYSIDKEITEQPNYLHDRREFWRTLGIRRYDYPLQY